MNRVCLSDPHETGDDYINASFIGVSKTLYVLIVININSYSVSVVGLSIY